MKKFKVKFNRGGDICVEIVEADDMNEAKLIFIMTHGAECSIEEIEVMD